MILKLQWLVNIYTHPNQIPGYASDVHLCQVAGNTVWSNMARDAP